MRGGTTSEDEDNEKLSAGLSGPVGKKSAHGLHLPEEAAQADGPAGQQSIRRQNLALVLREVMDNGPRSRAGIAEMVGLSRSTVSSLVGELIERGFLLERELERGGSVGRPGRLVALSDTTVVALGLEVNVDYLAACVLDLTGNIRHEQFIVQDNRTKEPSAVLDTLADLAKRALESVEREGLVPVGTTLAIPGLVDYSSGMLLAAPNLGWGRMPLEDELVRRLDRPHHYVCVENMANLAALGELWIGRGHKWGDFIRISGEIGMGGALVTGGGLLRFGSGLGGEFGHITVDPQGPECACGSRGCLVKMVGQEALLKAAGLEAPVGSSIAYPGGGISVLVESARRGDPQTIQALATAGSVLGIACASVVNVISPNTVVLGGMFAALFPWLSGPLSVEIERRAFLARYSPVAVVRSEIGSLAAARGAATLALRAVCADPFLVSG